MTVSERVQYLMTSMTTDEMQCIADADKDDPAWPAEVSEQETSDLRAACKDYIQMMANEAERRAYNGRPSYTGDFRIVNVPTETGGFKKAISTDTSSEEVGE